MVYNFLHGGSNFSGPFFGALSISDSVVLEEDWWTNAHMEFQLPFLTGPSKQKVGHPLLLGFDFGWTGLSEIAGWLSLFALG